VFGPVSASLFGDFERCRSIAGLDIVCGGDEVIEGGEAAS
jgi:hypothetical protein